MTSESLRAGLINESNIREALVTCRGDLFAASGYLCVSPRELDRYIRASEELQDFASAIAVVKRNHEYDRMSAEQFRHQLDQITLIYKVEAIEIIRDLATMDFDTAAMAEVKLKAAVQLKGVHHDSPANSGQESILAELNELYKQSAPRIKSIRVAAQIEFEEQDSDQMPSAHQSPVSLENR